MTTPVPPPASAGKLTSLGVTTKLGCAAITLFACLGLLFSAVPAQAAVTHEYIPGVSGALGGGVPEGQPPPTITGPLHEVKALTVDSGHVWVADKLLEAEGGATRVDEFDDATGAFMSQLGEEAGVAQLDEALAVGHEGGEEQVYVVAARAGAGVVAVYAKGHVEGVWMGANTPNASFTQSSGKKAGVLTGVAVDGTESLSEASGDVYVSTFGFPGSPGFDVVDVFKPVAGGGEPAKVVAQIKGTCASPGTTCPGKEIPFTEPQGVAVSGFNEDVLVTDGEHTVDVFAPTVMGEYEFVRELAGTPTGPFEKIRRGNGVAVDAGSGDIYVTDVPAGTVDEFNAEGEIHRPVDWYPGGPVQQGIVGGCGGGWGES